MKTEQPILITSIQAKSDLSASKNLLIGFDGDICGAASKCLGVLNANTNVGEEAPVVAQGIALVKSGAAIAEGAQVECDAAGKVVTKSLGVTIGYALDTANGADELIRVLLT